MNLTQSLQKWGNGTGVRIPKKVVDAAHLKLKQPLNIHLKNGSIILTPVKKQPKVSLETLLADVSPADIGGEWRWGKDIGAERYE